LPPAQLLATYQIFQVFVTSSPNCDACPARFPRPVHHRIPNFVDAEKAAQRLADLPEFKAAKVIKVNPDTPQKMVSIYWQRDEP
jgi:hypothetical protein